MKNIRVYLTLDADQDESTGLRPLRDQPTWESFRVIPAIHSSLLRRKWPYTVFLRCDNQIEQFVGQTTALYERHLQVWDLIRSDKSEIGWHPHLYVRDPQAGCDQILKVSDDCERAGIQFESVRLGEAWHSTQTMSLLSEIGYKVDSSAIPGRRRDDDVSTFDWEPTPNQPYYPLRSDYRTGRPEPLEDTLTILELPMTTSPIKTDYDREPLRRYLNPCFHNHLFRQGLERFLLEALSDPIVPEPAGLVLIFHPSELLPNKQNGLYAFSWTEFERNLDLLQSSLENSRSTYQFFTARQAAR